MTKVVQTRFRKSDRRDDLLVVVVDGMGRNALAKLIAEDKSVVIPCGTSLQSIKILLRSMVSEQFDHACGGDKGAALAVLR